MKWKKGIPIRLIIKYVHNRAAILKGIAAFFYSTEFYVIALIPLYVNGVFTFHAVFFVNPCDFLFKQNTDKPCFSPGCRSPPFSFVFGFIFKNRMEERHMKNYQDNDYALNKVNKFKLGL